MIGTNLSLKSDQPVGSGWFHHIRREDVISPKFPPVDP